MIIQYKRGTSKKGRRLKSGREKTASDFIKVEMEWPHYHDRKPAHYDDLAAVEFVHGYLTSVLEGNHNARTKDHMLRHLKDLMLDESEFSFEAARNCHGIVLQHLEQARLTWADKDRLQELRRKYAQRRLSEESKSNKSARDRDRTPLFCLKYQEQRCSYNEDHQTTRGFVKHTCAYCLRVIGNTYRHPELAMSSQGGYCFKIQGAVGQETGQDCDQLLTKLDTNTQGPLKQNSDGCT